MRKTKPSTCARGGPGAMRSDRSSPPPTPITASSTGDVALPPLNRGERGKFEEENGSGTVVDVRPGTDIPAEGPTAAAYLKFPHSRRFNARRFIDLPHPRGTPGRS